MNLYGAASPWWSADAPMAARPSTRVLSCARRRRTCCRRRRSHDRRRSAGCAQICFRRRCNIALTLLRRCCRLDRAAAGRFLLIDAVWSGADREACLATPATGGRRLLGVRARLSPISSTAPIRSPSAGGSICSLRARRSASSGCCGSTRRAATSARCTSSSCCRSLSFILLYGLPLLGLRSVSTPRCGAACW